MTGITFDTLCIVALVFLAIGAGLGVVLERRRSLRLAKEARLSGYRQAQTEQRLLVHPDYAEVIPLGRSGQAVARGGDGSKLGW